MSDCRGFLGLRWMLSLIAISLVGIVGCKRPAAASGPPSRPPASVGTASVILQDVPYYIDEIGRCGAAESVAIVAQVAGRVDSTHFTEGAIVKKGDLLITIDPRPFQAALAQQDASLLQSQESLKL